MWASPPWPAFTMKFYWTQLLNFSFHFCYLIAVISHILHAQLNRTQVLKIMPWEIWICRRSRGQLSGNSSCKHSSVAFFIPGCWKWMCIIMPTVILIWFSGLDLPLQLKPRRMHHKDPLNVDSDPNTCNHVSDVKRYSIHKDYNQRMQSNYKSKQALTGHALTSV